MHRWLITRRTISVLDLGTTTAYVPEQVVVQGLYYTEENGFHKFHNGNGAVVFSIASDSIEILRRFDAVIEVGGDLQSPRQIDQDADELLGAASGRGS